MATLTASTKARTSVANPGLHTPEAFEAVLQKGLDEVFKRRMEMPIEGMQLYRKKPTKQQTLKFQSYFGLGAVSQNRDADQIPYDEMGLGFGQEISTNIFRGGIAIEKQLEELELYGTIRDLQSELVESYRLAQELVAADGINRAFGDSGAPFLCEDGLYLIDADRPQPYAAAGNWSNVEASTTITPSSFYQTQLNFAAYRDERGNLRPLQLKRIIIRPSEELAVWEILKSDLRPTDAMNAKNFQFGRFEYTVYNYMTTAQVLYMAGETSDSMNELYWVDRVQPEIDTWKDGVNPDIKRQRIRGAFGIGACRPHFWRGAKLL